MQTMTIVHDCGHKARIKLSGTATTKSRQIWDAQNRDCDACRLAHGEDLIEAGKRVESVSPRSYTRGGGAVQGMGTPAPKSGKPTVRVLWDGGMRTDELLSRIRIVEGEG